MACIALHISADTKECHVDLLGPMLADSIVECMHSEISECLPDIPGILPLHAGAKLEKHSEIT